jgi:ribonuclease Z
MRQRAKDSHSALSSQPRRERSAHKGVLQLGFMRTASGPHKGRVADVCDLAVSGGHWNSLCYRLLSFTEKTPRFQIARPEMSIDNYSETGCICVQSRIIMPKSAGYVLLQIVTALLILVDSRAATTQAAQPAGSDFKVMLLGTSTPNPLPDRFGPSTLVEAGSEKLLFDCGRGATIRLWQLKIPLGTVKLFITHLHSDHTVGIPDLWLTGFMSMPYGRRSAPFGVWGPKGTAEMMSYLEKAYQADIENRREFFPNLTAQQVAVTARGIQEGVVYDHSGVRVTAFKVTHANLKDTFGFRIDSDRRAVVISGDMTSNENFIKYAQGADLVIHEVGVARPELLEKDPEVRRMLAAHHSSPEDAARDFARIKPKLAIYTHYTRPRSADIPEVTIPEILSRTRAIYSGRVEAGEDLMSISIGHDALTVTRNGQ